MKAVRQRALELHIPARSRTDKAKKERMEQLSREKLVRFPVVTVYLVPDHWVTYMLHMHSDLMRAASLKLDIDQSGIIVSLYDIKKR